MGMIETVQKAIKGLQSDFFLWRKCSDYHDGELAKGYSFIYAESENYVVRDDKLDCYYFVQARSPESAFVEVLRKVYGKKDN